MNAAIKEIILNRYAIAGIESLFCRIRGNPAFAQWQSTPHTFCFYGANQYSRNVQVIGLKEAFEAFHIPFHIVYKGEERKFNQLLGHKVILLTNGVCLPEIEPLVVRNDWRVVLFWKYYDDTPDSFLAPKVSDEEKAVLERVRKYVSLVVSELSPEGNKVFLSGYLRDFGFPVMTFPWGVSIGHHVPFECDVKRNVLYIGTYYEKARRVEQFFGKVLKHYPHTVIGPDWELSKFKWLYNSFLDVGSFNEKAPNLYSSHLISLSIHHLFEEKNGFSCNERVFNAIACGGFVVSDNVQRIRDFFTEEECVIARNPEEYYETVTRFVKSPETREPYMEKSLEKVYRYHTYHHRVADLIAEIFSGQPTSEFCPVMTINKGAT